MTNPINPGVGAPVPRTTSESRPKTNAPVSQAFSIPSTSGDTVSARGNLSFGSLAPLVNTNLTSDAAIQTAQQMEKLLERETLPLVNNRPQVVSSLVESLLGDKS